VNVPAGPARFATAAACAEALVEQLGNRIVLALPLGLGKAAALANALYARAKAHPDFSLEILTALTLEVPRPKSALEARFLEPIAARLFEDCAALDYALDQRAGRLPPNVRVSEFYFRPGANLGLATAQQNYVSLNYTHAAREMLARGVNVIGQLVARRTSTVGAETYSLSCNPDVTLDLLDAAGAAGQSIQLIGEINDRLPFMPNDAVLPAAAFDCVIDDPDCCRPLFPVPNRPVALVDHAIALRVAALVKDGGTLQIGIGSLGDAIAHAIALRRTANAIYRALVQALDCGTGAEPRVELDDLPAGLYGCSEMFVEGFLHLRRAGVLNRVVAGDVWMHGGFFLGSARFYEALRTLPEAERRGIDMTRISFTNGLLGDEAAKRRDRLHGRFVNTAMMLTLLGAAVSDGLDDGRVVSGVGGQYNFVAMAHELAGARSILMAPATRIANGVVASNIVWNYAHTTIPRHLRDIAVTEYGVADLRGKSDRDVIAAMLCIADSRFQDELMAHAKRAGKLEGDFAIPERCRNNRPDALEARLRASGALGALPWFPLGSDFSEVESALAVALGLLADLRGERRELARLAWRGVGLRRSGGLAQWQPLLERIGLAEPRSLADRLAQVMLVAVLADRVFGRGRPLLA
jgi:acyl-CoA hydrolase